MGQMGIKILQSHRAHHATTSNARQRKVEVPNRQTAFGIAETIPVLAFLAIWAKRQDESQRRPSMEKWRREKISRNLDSPVVGSSCCPGQLPEDCQHQNALDDYLGMAKRLTFPSSKAIHSSGREDILENRCASISNHCSIDGNNGRAGIFPSKAPGAQLSS